MPFLRERLLIAFNERLAALPDLPPKLAHLVNAPAEAKAEIRGLASTTSPSVKTALAFWAAYFQEPELSLKLWSEGTRSPDGLWQPLMRNVRKLPAFKEVVREFGLVDYWRA